MDDGFQSAAIHFDFALLVIDAMRGIGNGHVIPGGPMRAPLLDQMRRASALLVIGEGSAADRVIRMAGRAAKPVYTARLKVQKPRSFKNCRVLAYAAIGNPEKFFGSLRSVGAEVVVARGFGDHHDGNVIGVHVYVWNDVAFVSHVGTRELLASHVLARSHLAASFRVWPGTPLPPMHLKGSHRVVES